MLARFLMTVRGDKEGPNVAKRWVRGMVIGMVVLLVITACGKPNVKTANLDPFNCPDGSAPLPKASVGETPDECEGAISLDQSKGPNLAENVLGPGLPVGAVKEASGKFEMGYNWDTRGARRVGEHFLPGTGPLMVWEEVGEPLAAGAPREEIWYLPILKVDCVGLNESHGTLECEYFVSTSSNLSQSWLSSAGYRVELGVEVEDPLKVNKIRAGGSLEREFGALTSTAFESLLRQRLRWAPRQGTTYSAWFSHKFERRVTRYEQAIQMCFWTIGEGIRHQMKSCVDQEPHALEDSRSTYMGIVPLSSERLDVTHPMADIDLRDFDVQGWPGGRQLLQELEYLLSVQRAEKSTTETDGRVFAGGKVGILKGDFEGFGTLRTEVTNGASAAVGVKLNVTAASETTPRFTVKLGHTVLDPGGFNESPAGLFARPKR